MPKLPGAQREVQVGGLLKGPSSTAGARGEKVGAALRGVAGEMQKIVDRNRMLEAKRILSDFVVAETEAFELAKNNAAEGGAGFLTDYQEGFHDRREKFLGMASENAVRNMASEAMIKIKTEQESKATVFEVEARAKKAAADADVVMTNNKVSAMSGYSDRDPVKDMDEHEQMLNDIFGDARQKPGLVNHERSEVLFAHGVGELKRDFGNDQRNLEHMQSFQKELRREGSLWRMERGLTEERYNQLLSVVDARVESLKGRRKSKGLNIGKEYIRAGYGANGEAGRDYDDERMSDPQFYIDHGVGEEEAKSLAKQAENSDIMRYFYNTLRETPLEDWLDIEKTLNQKMMEEGYGHFDENSFLIASFNTIKDSLKEQLDNDPVSYVKKSDNLSLDIEARDAVVNNPESTPEDKAEAESRFYDAIEEEQKRIGVHSLDIRYLSNPQRDDLQKYLMDEDVPAKQVFDRLVSEKIKSGERWISVLDEFGGEMDGTILAAVAAMDTGRMNEALRAVELRNPETLKNLKTIVGPTRIKDMQDKLAVTLAPLFSNMGINEGNDDLMNKYMLAVENNALYKMSRNPDWSSKKAIEASFDDYFGGYHFSQGLSVDKATVSSARSLEEGLTWLANNPDTSNISVPQQAVERFTDEEAADQYFNDAFAEGAWVPVGDKFSRVALLWTESGERKYDNVRDLNGEILLWDKDDIERGAIEAEKERLERRVVEFETQGLQRHLEEKRERELGPLTNEAVEEPVEVLPEARIESGEIKEYIEEPEAETAAGKDSASAEGTPDWFADVDKDFIAQSYGLETKDLPKEGIKLPEKFDAEQFMYSDAGDEGRHVRPESEMREMAKAWNMDKGTLEFLIKVRKQLLKEYS
jgi:hypothetical protein